MNGGTPSIIDIVAPGKTGLSEEGWAKALELLARMLRSQAEKFTLPKFEEFLCVIGVSKNAVDGVDATMKSHLKEQGVFFSANANSTGRMVDWYAWGVLRRGSLLFLAHVIQDMAADSITIQILEATPTAILSKARNSRGDSMNYFKSCQQLAYALGEFTKKAEATYTNALVNEVKAGMIVNELSRFKT